MRLALAAALTALALPAAAQDLSGQFAGAVRTFTLPGTASLGTEDVTDDDPIMELLPRLEGNWASLNVIFPTLDHFDPEILAEICQRHPSTLTRTADRSFEMRRTAERDGETFSMAVRFDWVTGNSFDRSVSEAEVVPFLALDRVEEIPPGMLALPNLRGPVNLFYPGADILVMVSPNLPPEFWGRCPS